MMYLLYLFISLMLLAAISLLAIIRFRHPKTFSRFKFISLSLMIVLFSLGIYQLTGNKTELKHWLVYGKRQYQFLMAYERLGGLDGMIKFMEKKVAARPYDVQAWTILGKLYIARQKYPLAKEAFTHAQQLRPEDQDIDHDLDVATNPANYDLL